MRSIRVAAVSMNSPFGRTAEILDRIGGFCEQAAADRADLAIRRSARPARNPRNS